MNRRVILSFTTFVLLLLASIAAIAYTKGYRPNLKKTGPKVSATGLLVATSNPNGAQVFVDDHLTTATNDTLSLPEGNYAVKIVKDGYIPWGKKLKIKNGVVTETQARLFPSASDLRAETSTGAILPTLSPDGTKIVYGVASGSAEKRGVWVMDMNDRPLLSQAQSRQIAQSLAQADFAWSPDSKQILASTEKAIFLLEADRLNPMPLDVTPTLNLLLQSWENDAKSRENDRLGNLKPNLLKELEKMKIISWAPDETKILYTASQSATLPPILEKPMPAASTQDEQREIKEGSTYIYDIKEDKNFLITEKSLISQEDELKKDKQKAEEINPLVSVKRMGQLQRAQTLRWLPDSRHLVWVEENGISILEYDGTNKDTIYSGPFEDSFVYPWPNGSKLIILTTYNRPGGATPNLYSISL